MSEGEGVKRFLSGAESAKPESSEAEAWPMCSFSLEFTQLQSNWKIEIRDEFGFERQVLGCFLVTPCQTAKSWLLLSEAEAKKKKTEESDAAGGESEVSDKPQAKAMPARPTTPPKAASPVTKPQPADQPEAARPAEFVLPAPEKEFALADLKSLVTSLGALDACLVHFSSKMSTPESTLEAGEEAAAGAETQAVPMEEEVDWGTGGGEEQQGDETSWKDLTDSVKNMGGASAEEIQRLSELLSTHKAQIEKVVEQQEAKEKEATAAGEVLNLLMSQDWDGAAAVIARLRPEQLEQTVDYSGLTVLHHAVRSLKFDLVMAIVGRCPSLANRTTHPHRQPGHWTPLMIFANLPGAAQADGDGPKIGYLLAQHMNLDSLNVRGSSMSTATHMAVSRSNWPLVKSILYRLDDLGGKTAVMNHTKMVNNNDPPKRCQTFFCFCFLWCIGVV